MPRIRSLKPGFFKDPELAELPIEARMFYAGLWCQADREGRLNDEPKLLKVEIAPYDPIDAEAVLTLLAKPRPNKPGFIVRYEVHGRRYISIPRFLDHQKPYCREPESKIPPPSGEVVPKHEQSSAIAVLSLVLDPVLGDPPIPPASGGRKVISFKHRRRARTPLTPAEQQTQARERAVRERANLLLEHLGYHALERAGRLAWVNEHWPGPPEAAEAVVALVEQSLSQPEVRNGH